MNSDTLVYFIKLFYLKEQVFAFDAIISIKILTNYNICKKTKRNTLKQTCTHKGNFKLN